MKQMAARLVEEMEGRGHWRGELSSSALSTATAVCTLELYRRARLSGDELQMVGAQPLQSAVEAGTRWLCRTQNPDGGWGDTVDSPSNISTTALSWAALGLLAAADEGPDGVLDRADGWLREAAGELAPAALERAITRRYGYDRTFSAPILTMCALAGRLGEPRRAWAHVPALPFELAVLPRGWFRLLGLPTVSYALPALIAIGQARHHHRPSPNPLARLARELTRERTLQRLSSIQPPNGGFLEATPLTAFVTMSLVSIGESNHRVVRRGVDFLLDSMREDGSWPVDTDLATWVTTLAIEALADGGRLRCHLGDDELGRLGAWLLGQQFRESHPYTGARPGGWAWTDLPGGVPDADDTAGALIALRRLADVGAVDGDEALEAAGPGVHWLLDLQNRDGGIPTFCRGWGKLPFDRSGADLTAHALRAWDAWHQAMPPATRHRLGRATRRAVRYLVDAQRPDGAWVPLWFGNQAESRGKNPVYGTARVLLAGRAGTADGREPRQRAPDDRRDGRPEGASDLGRRWREALRRGRRWLLAVQNPDGGWGGGPSLPSTVEETALAARALTAGDGREPKGAPWEEEAAAAQARALAWLADRTSGSEPPAATPIGLYFAELWYSERLYPLIFTTAAVEAVSRRRGIHAGSDRQGTGDPSDRRSAAADRTVGRLRRPGPGEDGTDSDRTGAGGLDAPRRGLGP